jgi:serine protease AprX
MAFTRLIAVCILFISTRSAAGQVNRYMVFFKDKNGSPYSISQPDQFLSEKAITRRLVQNISITQQDLPVNPAYVAQVSGTGADVYYKSKWFNAVLVQCDQSIVTNITAIPSVDHVEYVAPGAKLIPSGRKRFNLRKKETQDVVTELQLSMLGINYAHQLERKGEEMTIAVLDAGFQGVNIVDPFKHLFDESRVDENVSFDFVFNTTNVYQYDDHGTEVLSVIAAEVPDAFTGGAPNAKFQLYVTEDVSSEYRIEEYNWAFAAERADSAGADIINSSLGYYDFDNESMNYTKEQMDGKTTVSTRAAQWASERGIVVVVSAGNEGNIASWRIIAAPADAEGVLSVGNVDAQGNKSSSSSIGPSADGRIKPDVSALGTGVKTIKPSGSIGSASGTSLSAPLVTSLVAVLWQHYRDEELTSVQIVDLLKKSASNASLPNNNIGYGIPHFQAAVNYWEREKNDQEEMFLVLPNRVTLSDTNMNAALVKLRPKDPDLITSCYVELISSLGQTLAAQDVSFNWLNREYVTDFTSLSPGVYFMRVTFENKKYVFRIVRV